MGIFKKKEKVLVSYPAVDEHGLCFKSLGDRKIYLGIWWVIFSIPPLLMFLFFTTNISIDNFLSLVLISIFCFGIGAYKHYIISKRKYNQIHAYAIISFFFIIFLVDSFILSRIIRKSKSEYNYYIEKNSHSD